MLDKLSAVLQYRSPDVWVNVLGQVPDQGARGALKALVQDRPAARRHEKGMVITVPTEPGQWLLWILSEVPPVNDLAALMTRIQELSRGLVRLSGETGPMRFAPEQSLPAPGRTPAELFGRLRSIVQNGARLKQAGFMASVLDQLVELGYIEGGALLRWRGPAGAPRVWLSDSRYRSHTREIGIVAASARTASDTLRMVTASGHGPDELDLAVLMSQFRAKATALVLPAEDSAGYGIVGFGAREEDLPALRMVADLCEIQFPIPSRSVLRRRWVRRLVAGAVIGAMGWWLSVPVKLTVAAMGETVGGAVSVIALPADGYLRTMNVRVGDPVVPGQVIAEFESPTLVERLAEERLAAAIEQLNAQAALAENRFSDYQLAISRLDIADTRIAQIEDRLESLRIKAAAQGRVIEAMSDTVLGAFSQIGQEVAAIQTSDRVQLRLRVAKLDARLVDTGMIGEVYFLGLSERSFAVTILTPPHIVVDPQTGAEHFEVMAEVAESEGLIIGLAGFARLEGPVAPRAMSYGRYAIEFIREKSWTYLGLKF